MTNAVSVSPSPPSQTRRSSARHRPSCTHIHMERVYGSDDTCDMCKQKPSIGFLYQCQPDTATLAPQLVKRKSSKKYTTRDVSRSPAPPGLEKSDQPDDYPTKTPETIDEAIEMMRHFGISPAIIRAAAADCYSMSQALIVIEQKQNVEKVIAEVHPLPETLNAEKGPPPKLLSAMLIVAGGRFPHSQDTKPPEDIQYQAQMIKPCKFKVCHTCRPYCRDRCLVTIDKIVHGEIEMPQERIPHLMRVLPKKLLMNIGLRKIPLEPEHSWQMTSEELGQALTSKTTTMKRSLVQSLTFLRDGKERSEFERAIIKDLVKMIHQATARAEPTGVDPDTKIAYKVLQTLCARCRHRPGKFFDFKLWRAMAQCVLIQAAQIPLPGEEDPLSPSAECLPKPTRLAENRSRSSSMEHSLRVTVLSGRRQAMLHERMSEETPRRSLMDTLGAVPSRGYIALGNGTPMRQQSAPNLVGAGRDSLWTGQTTQDTDAAHDAGVTERRDFCTAIAAV